MLFYDFKPLDKKGREYDLATYKNKVVMVINTASKCAFTSQLADLESLYRELKAKHGDDVEFIGFPCDQFGHGDPDGNDAIQNFCAVNYGVSFPVLGKTIVNGDSATPLYQWMKDEMPGIMGIRRVKWNFEKFLIDRHGKVVRRWASTSNAGTLKPAISQALAV